MKKVKVYLVKILKYFRPIQRDNSTLFLVLILHLYLL